MLAARRGKTRLGVAHQAARRVFLVGVENRSMPRELAASVLPAFRVNIYNSFYRKPY
jgi:hypothetical protein